MKHKKYKELSKEKKEEWLFRKLNDKINNYSLGSGILFYFIIQIFFSVQLILMLGLAHYKPEYSYLMHYFIIILKAMFFLCFIAIGEILLNCFNGIYRGYKLNKLTKAEKK